jgi:hypothetical protein
VQTRAVGLKFDDLSVFWCLSERSVYFCSFVMSIFWFSFHKFPSRKIWPMLLPLVSCSPSKVSSAYFGSRNNFSSYNVLNLYALTKQHWTIGITCSRGHELVLRKRTESAHCTVDRKNHFKVGWYWLAWISHLKSKRKTHRSKIYLFCTEYNRSAFQSGHSEIVLDLFLFRSKLYIDNKTKIFLNSEGEHQYWYGTIEKCCSSRSIIHFSYGSSLRRADNILEAKSCL